MTFSIAALTSQLFHPPFSHNLSVVPGLPQGLCTGHPCNLFLFGVGSMHCTFLCLPPSAYCPAFLAPFLFLFLFPKSTYHLGRLWLYLLVFKYALGTPGWGLILWKAVCLLHSKSWVQETTPPPKHQFILPARSQHIVGALG